MDQATQAYIFCDLDGCLALNDHRGHLVPTGEARNDSEAWREYVMACRFDELNHTIDSLIRGLAGAGYFIQIGTGRMEYARGVTAEWLLRHHVPFGNVMHRADDDYRSNALVKEAMLDTCIAQFGALPSMAIEDDPDTIAMYRRRGVNVLSVATRSSCLTI